MTLLILVIIVFFSSCSSTNTLTIREAKQNQAVKLFLTDGQTDNGIIINNDYTTLEYISGKTHEKHTVDYQDIMRIEKMDIVYDYQAYQISKAEIDKVKGNRSTWGYAIGGAVIGAAAGLAVGLPFWDDVSPLIFSGTGAVLGSIFFAFKGQNKDKDNAIDQIRFIRTSESDLQKQVDEEKKRLEELEEKKKQMQDQLNSKDK
jgi:hypothetical protein